MIEAWGAKDVETFVNLHANPFTLNFCPNAITSLQAYTGTMTLTRDGLKAWNERTWGPGKAFLPTAPPQWKDFCEVGDKVYMNGVMPMKVWGTQEVKDQRWFFCFTVKDGVITEANVNGDLTSFYGKVRNLEEKNTASVKEMLGYWKTQQTEKFLACHTEDFAWNFLPCSIDALKHVCGPNEGRDNLAKFNETHFGPGKTFEPLDVVEDAFHGVGNQVLGTMRMLVKVLGKGPINLDWRMRFTLENGLVKKVLMLADTTEIAELLA
jgi:hypothetical protein